MSHSPSGPDLRDDVPPDTPLSARPSSADRLENVTERIPVFEEQVSVSKRAVEAGLSTIGLRTSVVEEVVRTILERETLEIERVTIGRTVERAPEIRVEGDVTIIPVVEEIAVVEKRLVLREELHVRRRVVSEASEQPVTLRRQEVTIEHRDGGGRPITEREKAR